MRIIFYRFSACSAARIGEFALSKCTGEIAADDREGGREGGNRTWVDRQTKSAINANLKRRVIVRFSMWLLFFAGLSASRSIFVLLPFRSLCSRYRVLKKSGQKHAAGRKRARAVDRLHAVLDGVRREGNMNSCAKTESFLLSPLDDVFFLVRHPPSLCASSTRPPARLCLSCVDSACSSVSFVLSVRRPSAQLVLSLVLLVTLKQHFD